MLRRIFKKAFPGFRLLAGVRRGRPRWSISPSGVALTKGLSKGLSSTLKGLRGSNNTLQQITTGGKCESAVPQGIEKINCDEIQQATIEWTIIGKDEVPSSNLGSSSKNPRKLRFLGIFCCKKFLCRLAKNF